MTSITLDKQRLNNRAGEIWKSAERLRGKFKAHEYQSVILPIIVIRRLECVLIKWREDKKAEIHKAQPMMNDKQLNDLVKKLELNPVQSPFSNKTNWTLQKIYEEDHALLETNFRAYINGFSNNVNEIIEHFNYRAVIGQMVKNNRLAPILNQYKDLPLGPNQLSGLEMGYIYEELLRRFSEQSGEEAGDHFTPREIIRLMVQLLNIPIPDKHISIYDPACGTGGMLSVAKEHLLDNAITQEEKKRVEKYITVHGEEIQPVNYAICKADMLIKGDKNAKIFYGNSLIPHDPYGKEPGDQLSEPKHCFDFMLSNPPFGVTWGGKDGYETEARKLGKTRYHAGMPRVNDGALLFLQTMLAKMKEQDKGGSRIAIIFNGSPLSNGDCGLGESEIRRWIIENDWLDAIVMLPDQLFYNTGISTYIWLLRNEKPVSNHGRVMIIDARNQFEKEPKAFANKRNRMTNAHRQWVEERYRKDWASSYNDPFVKIFENKDFAYHKVKVIFWQTDENGKPEVINERYDKDFSVINIKKEQAFYNCDLIFHVCLQTLSGEETIQFSISSKEDIVNKFKKMFGSKPEILSVSWTHPHYVDDDEYIPFGVDINAFLKREIGKQIIRWKDSPQLGYEILPNKYFYHYESPRPAKELLAEFWQLEKDAEIHLEKFGIQ